jgi:hypothetical protein
MGKFELYQFRSTARNGRTTAGYCQITDSRVDDHSYVAWSCVACGTTNMAAVPPAWRIRSTSAGRIRVWALGDDVLSKDEKVERVDDWSALGLSGAVESSQPGGVLVVGDQLQGRVCFPAEVGQGFT